MGILSALLGADNPAAQWAQQNRGWKGAIGAGLASGPTFEQGLANAAMNGPQGQTADDAYAASEAAKAERQAQINQTSEYLRSTFPDLAEAVNAGMPMDAAWNEAMKRKQPGYGQQEGGIAADAQQRGLLADQQGLTGAAKQEFILTGKLPGGNQTTRAGVGQPIYGRNKETNAIEPWQSMTDGTMVNIANPNADPSMYDFNPGIAAGERTGSTVDAKTAGAARAALRGAEVSNQNTAKAVAELRNNAAGMKEWFSQIGPRGVYINPGSEMGKFYAAAEPTNNQGFMQAREMLKGGGQITDYEGRKAEDAFSRMRASLETGDQAQYLRALSDFEEAVATGYAKLQETAAGGYSAGGSGGGSDYKTKYGLE